MDTFPLLQYPDIHKTSSIPEIFIDGQIIYLYSYYALSDNTIIYNKVNLWQ